MRQQVQRRARRQRTHQGQRVGDRAFTQRRVIERIDAIAVAREQVATRLRVHASTACRRC